MRILLAAFAFLAFSLTLAPVGNAQGLYDLASLYESEPLATLQIHALPADSVEDFGTLVFTPAGRAIFGADVGVWEFDEITGGETLTEVDGLLSTVGDGVLTLIDNVPPDPTSGRQENRRVELSILQNFQANAEITLFDSFQTPNTVSFSGVFRAVPEPTSAAALLAALAGAVLTTERCGRRSES